LFAVALGGFDRAPSTGALVPLATTMSHEAFAALDQHFTRAKRDARAVPEMARLEAMHRARLARPDGPVDTSQIALDGPHPRVTRRRIVGVPVLDISPAVEELPRKVLIHFHGGAFVVGSPDDTLHQILQLASLARVRIISVDYTLAPFAGWQTITTEAYAIAEAVLKEHGRNLDDLALIGESAGGNLATVTALQLQAIQGKAPAAVILWSPWADLTSAGDSRVTLAQTGELTFTYDGFLKQAAAFYAGSTDLHHPSISPVYAQFSAGFSATLIQVGTRELLLSDAVRLARTIDQSGGAVTLDVYEGMPHVFQRLVGTPESEIAINKSAKFLRQHFGLEPRP
jgi:epsilon-lactone hydrolase